MNKNIIERLKKEAQESVLCGRGYYCFRLDENKFVELIVKECVDVCLQSWSDEIPKYECEAQRMNSFTSEFCAKSIKKHFGVK